MRHEVHTLSEAGDERRVAGHCVGLDHRFVEVRSHALVVAADQRVVLRDVR